MIYKIVFVIVVLNLICDMLELILPSKKLKNTVKSFVLTLMIYVVCGYLFDL